MTQWLLEEALHARLDAQAQLAEHALLEQRELRHAADQARRDAHAALERG